MRLLQVIFAEIIVVLAVVIYTSLGGVVDGAYWWHLAHANGAEWRACHTKHDLLLQHIKKEQLWKRLGMDQQPWLR